MPYASDEDFYGVRNRYDANYRVYLNRAGLEEVALSTTARDNEVMFKNALSPDHLDGFVVDSKTKKRELVSHLMNQGLASIDDDGIIYIHILDRRVSADSFIHVGNKFQKDWWTVRE